MSASTIEGCADCFGHELDLTRRSQALQLGIGPGCRRQALTFAMKTSVSIRLSRCSKTTVCRTAQSARKKAMATKMASQRPTAPQINSSLDGVAVVVITPTPRAE
jgi:hypothetical protein